MKSTRHEIQLLLTSVAVVLSLAVVVWLRPGVLAVLGGALLLVLPVAHATVLKREAAWHSKILLWIVSYVCVTVALNGVVGLSMRLPESADFNEIAVVTVAAMLLLYGAGVCVAIAQVFIPGFHQLRGALEPPQWASRLMRKMMIPLLTGVFGLFAVWGLQLAVHSTDRVGRSGQAALILLAVSNLTAGWFALQAIPEGQPYLETPSPFQTMLKWSPTWIALGAVAEVYRGAWTLWVLSVLGVVSLIAWTERLVLRAAPPTSTEER